MKSAFVAVACAALVACVLALELPDVKDQPDKPIDPKQIKNATLTFYNNGTYIYLLEVPCDAYLGGGRGGQQQQRGGQQQQSGAHDEEDDEHEDDDEDANGQQQQSPQQRQRQQQQQRQRQQQQQRGGRSGSSSGSQHDHLNPDELRQAHEGTECECKCKNQEGEELDDIITVSMGGKSHGGQSQQRGGQRQQQQQRSQQQRQQQQQQQQRQRSTGGSSQQHDEEGEGPQLVYPAQPRPGQKCVFFEEGEWENDDDELIQAAGPERKTPGEPEDEVLEKCTFNFKKGGAGQQQQSSGAQQASLQCVDSHGEQDQYVIRIQNGELKPKLTPQQKQEMQKQKQQSKSQQGRSRNQ